MLLICIHCYCGPVGTHVGEIGIWEVGSQERLAHKNFKVWDLGSCSAPMQVTYMTSTPLWSQGNFYHCCWIEHILYYKPLFCFP